MAGAGVRACERASATVRASGPAMRRSQGGVFLLIEEGTGRCLPSHWFAIVYLQSTTSTTPSVSNVF